MPNRGLRHLPIDISKKRSGSNTLPTIKCLCGAEIAMLPDVKQMSQAIEAHILKHKKKIKDPKEAEVEAERIRDELIKQILEKASQTDN